MALPRHFMRPAHRTILSSLTSLSLLLCVATAALWVRSEFTPPPAVSWGNATAAVGRTLSISRGDVVLRAEWSKRPMALDERTRAMDVPQGRFDAPGVHRSRASWLPETIDGVRLPGTFGTHQETRVSFAWPAILFAAVAGGLIAYTLRRQLEPGQCLRCGYDLTGNISGICPECGTSVAK